MTEEKRRFGINGNTLKTIAIITMMIDHIGATIIEVGILDTQNMEHFYALLETEAGRNWYMIDMALRLIGRIAFPIFCYLLVEGFFHTRDRKKYALRLLAFSVISEIPFDLAVYNQAFSWTSQNVFFTLFLGVATMQALELVQGSKLKRFLMVVVGCYVAILLRTDYNAFGVAMILVFYMFHGNRRRTLIGGAIMAAVESISLLGAAALAMIPIARYNGERGKMNLKYFFYGFYPAHLMIFYIIRTLFVQP